MRVKRPHELEEKIAARNSRFLAPVKKARPVKISTDNNVETIDFWNTEINNNSLDVG